MFECDTEFGLPIQSYWRFAGKKTAGFIKMNRKDGKWIEWYDNGNKWSEAHYVEGKENGKWICWHENGNKLAEGNYVAEKKDGKWIYWHENGKKRLEGNYVSGKQVGKWIYWKYNGNKWSENIGGKWIYWYENGNKRLEENYLSGKPHGKWIFWYENGNKRSEGTYVAGKRDGKWIYYRNNEITYYRKGDEITLKEYLVPITQRMLRRLGLISRFIHQCQLKAIPKIGSCQWAYSMGKFHRDKILFSSISECLTSTYLDQNDLGQRYTQLQLYFISRGMNLRTSESMNIRELARLIVYNI